jgi:Ca2+-binding RTX toxin-like protein
MSKTIPGDFNDQYELDDSNETWTLAEGSKLTNIDGHGIHEGMAFHDNLIEVNGAITALSSASAGVATQGDGSSVIVGGNATIDAWYGVELFADNQSVVNNGILSVEGTGLFSDGLNNSIANNGIINVHPSAKDDVDGIVAIGDTDIFNNVSGTIDVTGNGITVKSVMGEVTEITNFGSVMAGSVAFYGWSGDEKLVNRGFMDGDIQMGAGKDIFDGIGGTAQGAVMGGANDDTYMVDTADIFLFEKDNEGVDSVQSKVSWSLGKFFENLTLTGSTAANGRGNEEDNIMIGNSKANKLTGLAGEDDLSGGKGNDRLLGGLGADTFHFSSGDGKDVIADFTNGLDLIDISDLSGVTSFTDLKKNHLTVSGSDLVITDGVDRLTIEDTRKSALDFFDFDF